MYVLGIETSCDETAAAVVVNGKAIRSNIIASSLKFHKKYGGVIPEIASRMHLDTINYVVENALKESGKKLQDIGLISVTDGPGLPGSLLIGLCFAKSLGLGLGIPLVGVSHLHAHIYSVLLKRSVAFPFVGLVVSGGHTSLFYVRDFDKIELLGSTLDDACGEAFDKVAKILGLGYPGGPVIERLAQKGTLKIKFNCSDTRRPLDFSFSGIKTAVMYYLQRHAPQPTAHKADIATSFQEAVIEALIKKSFLACRAKRARHLVMGGGVVMNNRLRQRFLDESGPAGIKVYFPDKSLCMDNAAMVAGLGYHLFRKGHVSNWDVTPQLA